MQIALNPLCALHKAFCDGIAGSGTLEAHGRELDAEYGGAEVIFPRGSGEGWISSAVAAWLFLMLSVLAVFCCLCLVCSLLAQGSCRELQCRRNLLARCPPSPAPSVCVAVLSAWCRPQELWALVTPCRGQWDVTRGPAVTPAAPWQCAAAQVSAGPCRGTGQFCTMAPCCPMPCIPSRGTSLLSSTPEQTENSLVFRALRKWIPSHRQRVWTPVLLGVAEGRKEDP